MSSTLRELLWPLLEFNQILKVEILHNFSQVYFICHCLGCIEKANLLFVRNNLRYILTVH